VDQQGNKVTLVSTRGFRTGSYKQKVISAEVISAKYSHSEDKY